jgi:hypothetical protein
VDDPEHNRAARTRGKREDRPVRVAPQRHGEDAHADRDRPEHPRRPGEHRGRAVNRHAPMRATRKSAEFAAPRKWPESA